MSEGHITLGRAGGTEVRVFRYMGSGDRLALDGTIEKTMGLMIESL
jgi:hypothetical protein